MLIRLKTLVVLVSPLLLVAAAYVQWATFGLPPVPSAVAMTPETAAGPYGFPAWLRLRRRGRGESMLGSGIRPIAELGWPIPDLRWLFLGFGLVMHLGIQLGVYVVWFSPLIVGAYVSFFTSDELERIGRRLRRPFVRLFRIWRRHKAKRRRERTRARKREDSGPLTIS